MSTKTNTSSRRKNLREPAASLASGAVTDGCEATDVAPTVNGRRRPRSELAPPPAAALAQPQAETPPLRASAVHIGPQMSFGAGFPYQPSALSDSEAKVVENALAIIEKRRLRNKPVLGDHYTLSSYLRLRFAGLNNEQMHILYLDAGFQLIEARAEFFGNQSSVEFNIRQCIFHAFLLGAPSVVFAHNHPGDNLNPSDEDIAHFEKCERILKHVGVNLLDSFVVTSRGVTSIKVMQKLNAREAAMRQQAETEPFVLPSMKRARTGAKTAARGVVDITFDPSSSAAPRERVGIDTWLGQYRALKADHCDYLLFYRMGDFYELLWEDAEIAAKALGLVLHRRGKPGEPGVSLCGVPVERSEDYLYRLIELGHKVAFAERVQDRAGAQHEVVRTVTPG